MRMYFINDKEFNEGPFDAETLKSKSINKETPIWFEELGFWVTAKEIEELEFLFEDESSEAENNYPTENVDNTSSFKSPLISFAALF
jgi:hypothetical protein